jgi:hypothetical protein
VPIAASTTSPAAMAGQQSEVPAGTEGNKPVSKPVDGDNLLSATLGVDGVAHIDDSPSWQRALDVVVHSCVVLRQVVVVQQAAASFSTTEYGRWCTHCTPAMSIMPCNDVNCVHMCVLSKH